MRLQYQQPLRRCMPNSPVQYIGSNGGPDEYLLSYPLEIRLLPGYTPLVGCGRESIENEGSAPVRHGMRSMAQ